MSSSKYYKKSWSDSILDIETGKLVAEFEIPEDAPGGVRSIRVDLYWRDDIHNRYVVHILGFDKRVVLNHTFKNKLTLDGWIKCQRFNTQIDGDNAYVFCHLDIKSPNLKEPRHYEGLMITYKTTANADALSPAPSLPSPGPPNSSLSPASASPPPSPTRATPSLSPAHMDDPGVPADRREYRDLFPYVYKHPWADLGKQDRQVRFIAPGKEIFGSDAGSPTFCDDLARLKEAGDSASMAKAAMDFIRGAKPGEGAGDKEGFITGLKDFKTIIGKFSGVDEYLRENPGVTLQELYTEKIEKEIGDWKKIRGDMFGVNGQSYKKEKTRAWESLFALLILPSFQPSLMDDLIRILVAGRTIEILAMLSKKRSLPGIKPDMLRCMGTGAILLPKKIFPTPPATKTSPSATPRKRAAAPYAAGELAVVRYRLKGWEPGDVCRIEHVMKGAYTETIYKRPPRGKNGGGDERLRTGKDDHAGGSTMTDFVHEIGETIREEKEAAGRPRAGDEETMGLWTVLGADIHGGRRSVASFAKAVVSRTVSRIRENVNRARTMGSPDAPGESVFQRIDNTGGDRDIRVVHRWLNRIYTIKTTTRGSRLIIGMRIAPPASTPVNSGSRSPHASPGPPVHPGELGLKKYADVSRRMETGKSGGAGEPNPLYYLNLLERYDIDDPIAPPRNKMVAAVLEGIESHRSTCCAIPEGYEAGCAYVSILFSGGPSGASASRDEPSDMAEVMAGGRKASYPASGKDSPPAPGIRIPLDGETFQVPVSIRLERNPSKKAGAESGASTCMANVKIECTPSPELVNEWKYRTHLKIMAGFKEKLAEYRLLKKREESGPSPVGARSSRAVEMGEVKKKCIALLRRIHVDLATEAAAGRIDEPGLTRFFENSLEWREMVYFPHPDDREVKHGRAAPSAGDGHGAPGEEKAMALAPVKPGKAMSFLFYLQTGAPWPGKDELAPTTAPFAAMVNDVKTRREKESEGAIWEVTVPTTMTALEDGEEKSPGKMKRKKDSTANDPPGGVYGSDEDKAQLYKSLQ